MGLLLIWIGALVCAQAPAQLVPNHTWTHYTNGRTVEAMEISHDGNLYVADQLWAVNKIDKDGNSLWPQPWSFPAILVEMKVSPRGHLILLGQDRETHEIVIAKLHRDGYRMWVHRYAHPGSQYNHPRGLTVDPTDGNIYVIAETYTRAGARDWLVLKYKPLGLPGYRGDLHWTFPYFGPENLDDRPVAIAANQGVVYFTGSVQTTPGHSNESGFDLHVMALNEDGSRAWAFPKIRHEAVPSLMTIDYSGNIIVGGQTRLGLTWDMVAIKFRPSGSLVYFRPLYRGTSDRMQGIAIDPMTNAAWFAGEASNWPNIDIWLVKLPEFPMGLGVWEEEYLFHRPTTCEANPSCEYYPTNHFGALSIDSWGNPILAVSVQVGVYYPHPLGPLYPDVSRDMLVMKYASNGGNVLWERHYDGAANGRDIAKIVRSYDRVMPDGQIQTSTYLGGQVEEISLNDPKGAILHYVE